MNLNKSIIKVLFMSSAIMLTMTACNDDEIIRYDVTVSPSIPEEAVAGSQLDNIQIKFTELNTHKVYTVTSLDNLKLPAGTYNVDGTATITVEENGKTVTKTIRTVANGIVISEESNSINLEWFFYNDETSLVFSEIYACSSLDAAGKGNIQDSYFRIYNNTDHIIYADGIAIAEGLYANTTALSILTPEYLPQNRFMVSALYAIPGNGTDVAIQPGESLKIVDQAIDWTEQVTPALNHTDADFEWYDESTNANKDIDNVEVPNLIKIYSSTLSFWFPNRQCNQSYALVKLPEGMTSEIYLEECPTGAFDYTMATVPDRKFTRNNVHWIPNDWIIDGVNLSPTSTFKQTFLSPAIDKSYAAIGEKVDLTQNAGKKFKRKVLGTSADGNIVLVDNNDSANDFEVVSAYED